MNSIHNVLDHNAGVLLERGAHTRTLCNLAKLFGLTGLAAGAISIGTGNINPGAAAATLGAVMYVGAVGKELDTTGKVLPFPFFSTDIGAIARSAGIEGEQIDQLTEVDWLSNSERAKLAMATTLKPLTVALDTLPEGEQASAYHMLVNGLQMLYPDVVKNVAIMPALLPEMGGLHGVKTQLSQTLPPSHREAFEATTVPEVIAAQPIAPILPAPHPAAQYTTVKSRQESIEPPAISVQAKTVAPTNDPWLEPKMPVMPPAEFIVPTSKDRDIPKEFASQPKTSMIIGVPGAGKGIFVSNAIRYLRAARPELQVWGIDPKNDPKETGYWEQGYDKVFRFDNERMSDDQFVEWISNCIDKFKVLEGEKLLVFDEITLSFRRWASTDKKSFDSYCNFKVSVASSGDSRGVYLWEVGQIANAADLNVSGGLRSISKPVAIVSNQDRRASDALLNTRFATLPAGGKEVIYQMCDRSPVGRAIYDYKSDSWQPMPKLKNYSGFDRDRRKFIGEK